MFGAGTRGALKKQGQGIGMARVFRIRLSVRRFWRRHPWLGFALRSFMIFSAAFGGAYGFIAGSRSEGSGYNPHAFAIGASFLFAIACVALATLSFRLRWMRQKLRKIALHSETLADRNWELQEAEQRGNGRSRYRPVHGGGAAKEATVVSALRRMWRTTARRRR